MRTGTCPACTRPYTASEIAGFGILRPRPAERGGPLLELTCPGCGRVIRLVPHGDGRYAPPGEPPPPAVPEAERRPPWMKDRPRRTTSAQAAGAPPERDGPEVYEVPAPESAEPGAGAASAEPPEDAGTVPDGARMTVAQALEILEISSTATTVEIDRAYRQRSRTCHPDKVAHLDADFQALAERKFRALKAAYDLLRP